MSTQNEVKTQETGMNIKETLKGILSGALPKLTGTNPDLAKKVDKAILNKKTTEEQLRNLIQESVEFLKTIEGVVDATEEAVAPDEKKDKKTVGGITRVKKTEGTDSKKTPVKVENEVKTEVKTPDKKTVPKKNGTAPTKKGDNKTPAKTKDKSLVKTETVGTLPLAVLFPETLEFDKLGKLKAAPYIKGYDDIAKALDEGKQFFIATYWTLRQIKEFNYSAVHAVKEITKSFTHNLDILEPVYTAETIKRVWAVSTYTDAMFRFDDEDFEHIEETNPYNGEKYRVRVSNGMEFEIYELVE